MPRKPVERKLRRWIDEFHRGYHELERGLWDTWWRANTDASKENEVALAKCEEAYRRFLADPRRHARLRSFSRHETDDELLVRQQLVITRLLEMNRLDEDLIGRIVPLEVEIESEFSNFRATFQGEAVPDNRLKEVLRQTDDPAVARQAWEASKQIAPRVAKRVVELVGLRNQAAHALGHDNYHRMALELDELPADALFDLLERLAEATETPFVETKREIDAELAARFAISTEELMPWHYGDPFFQSGPRMKGVDLDRFYRDQTLEELTRRFYSGIGLDVDEILRRSDLYERPGKCQHAFCVHVDRSGDVRVLCNLRADEEWMSTMLHEFGHAVYDKYLDAELPLILREPAHTLTTEAVAMLFGRLSRQRDFLVRVAGAMPADADAVSARAVKAAKQSELVFTRWALTVVHFERELYADPGQDLDGLWWRLVERYQHLRPPAGREAPDWASKIHIATSPVYYQNYLLGNLLASQLQRRLLDETLGGAESLVDRPEVGRFLRDELFRAGKRTSWQELVVRTTGRELDLTAFVEEFG